VAITRGLFRRVGLRRRRGPEDHEAAAGLRRFREARIVGQRFRIGVARGRLECSPAGFRDPDPGDIDGVHVWHVLEPCRLALTNAPFERERGG
jgi:hypothetical protein